MSKIFHPISLQIATAEIVELPKRLAIRASHTHAYRGSCAPGLQAQALLNQRWHLLFVHLNRRVCP
ncbi:hypothetical protein [Aeromonas bivalvium]|uniref:hypothetical protein n=1 Tax=Aeromonas bivalvium TaxID=440079 RepID=UPI0038D0C3CE